MPLNGFLRGYLSSTAARRRLVVKAQTKQVSLRVFPPWPPCVDYSAAHFSLNVYYFPGNLVKIVDLVGLEAPEP